MKRTTLLLAAACLPACQEVGIQNVPPKWPDSFPRPVEDVQQTDVVVQTQVPVVDILWMVDNSCSMGDDQARLSENFPAFMEYFLNSGLDYHIGVTSSDLIYTNRNGADGKLVVVGSEKYIDNDTYDPMDMFTQMAVLGSSGASPEKGIGAIFKCLEEQNDTFNAGFVRPEASLHTIVVSDEPDYTQEGLITQREFIEWYDGIKQETDERTFSSIVAGVGRRYSEVTRAIGGIDWDIYDDDWVEVMNLLGLQAAGLKREYFLSQQPVEDTLHVKVETAEGVLLDTFTKDVDWTWDPKRNSVVFAVFVPESMSKVIITYTRLASVQEGVAPTGTDTLDGQ